MKSAFIIPGLVAAGLLIGIADQRIWIATLVLGALPFVFDTVRAIARGKFGVDLIAVVAIVASLLAGQYLAGVVILLMLSGGEALEAYARERAKKELTELLSKAPSVAHVKRSGDKLVDVRAEEVRVGDTFVVKPGEVVPVDGTVSSGISSLDEAMITGESLPVEKRPGSLVWSGSINEDRPFEAHAIRASEESKYQIIVKLVQEAQNAQAPVVRLADRYAGVFNLLTFAFAGLAWILFQDPIRALAVLVVASPCPLILATPIAMISGISKAASRGIVIKSGGALERLGEVRGVVFDKTGTLTLGVPEVTKIVSVSDLSEDEVMKRAVSLDQLSAHIFARSLVQYAQKRDLELEYPDQFEEVIGQGVKAVLHKRRYFLGKLGFIESQGVRVAKSVEKDNDAFLEEGKTAIYLGDETKLLGFIVFADVIRPETKQLFASMAVHGLSKMVMLTGDKKKVAAGIAAAIGIKEYKAELLPEDKVSYINETQKSFGPVAMVGDGINDAPALAVASVGIAMASHGATVASETGDIVIMENDMHRVHDAIHIAQGALRLAKQGIFFGMGASVILMVFALFGYIIPVYGAVMQEALDVIVILNALRLNFQKI